MKNKNVRAKFPVFFVGFLLVCFLFVTYVAMRYPMYTSVQYTTKNIEDYTNSQLSYRDNHVEIINFNLYHDDKLIFHTILFIKFVRTFFNNAMLYTSFITMMFFFIMNALRCKRRRNFEETHFMHILILMNYIHHLSGECEYKRTTNYRNKDLKILWI